MLELQTRPPTRINAQIVAAPKEMDGRKRWGKKNSLKDDTRHVLVV